MDISPLYIDTREPSSTCAEFRLKLPVSSVVSSQRLESGDVAWWTDNETYGWELKSVSDCINSMWSKDKGERLERQLVALRENYTQPFLGIHGLLIPDGRGMIICSEPVHVRDAVISKVRANTRISAKQLEAFLFSIEHPNNNGRAVKVVWRPTREGLQEAICSSYSSSAKDSHTTFNHVLLGGEKKNLGDEELWQKIYLAVPGIGPKMAELLTTEFGPVSQLDAKKLRTLPGIGSKILAELRRATGLPLL